MKTDKHLERLKELCPKNNNSPTIEQSSEDKKPEDVIIDAATPRPCTSGSDNQDESLSDKIYTDSYGRVVVNTEWIKRFVQKLKDIMKEMGCGAQKDGDDDLSLGFRYALKDTLYQIDKIFGKELT